MKTFSFYYRDTIDLKILFPKACSFSLLFSDYEDNVVIENGIMRLNKPELFNPARIHNIVKVYKHRYDYFKIMVNIRCWIEDEYTLKETTHFRRFRSFVIYKWIRRAINKIYPLPFNTLLLAQDGVSFYSKNNKLIRCSANKTELVGKLPPLLHPRFYDFILFGNEAFLRTMGKIYMSNNGMTEWTLIYEGKRGIKDSMIWIEEDGSLLYLEYTPGLNLSRHHLFKYFVKTGETKTIMTFYSPDEHLSYPLKPYCRHLHVLKRDPYTKDIYLGTGDADEENAIYRSTDNGNTFYKMIGGSQSCRALTFFFTERVIMWNTDSPDPQFLNAIKRENISNEPIDVRFVLKLPLFNSACWNSFYDEKEDMYLMSSNCEGALYDNKYRIYGIRIINDVPKVYCLFEEAVSEKEFNQFNQLFVLGKDITNRYWFYDERSGHYRQYVLEIKK